MSFIHKTLSIALVLLVCAPLTQAGDAEITLKRAVAEPTERAEKSMQPMRAQKSRSVQKMLIALKPRAIPAATGGKQMIGTKPPEPPKYEVTDCTGSDGVDQACCFWSPGMGGSGCDVFLALCEQAGWSGSGTNNGAACKGEGTVE